MRGVQQASEKRINISTYFLLLKSSCFSKVFPAPNLFLNRFIGQENDTAQKQLDPLPHGLPNIGNTCFLNSALQQLYNIQLLRSQLNQDQFQTQNNLLLKQLANVFRIMKTRKVQRDSLIKIIEILEQRLPDYKLGMQSDSFAIFLQILNEIFENHPQIMENFQIEYTSKCECSQMEMNIKEIKIQSQQSICFKCKKPCKRNISKYPVYLIVHNGDKQTNKKFTDQMESSGMFYKLLSINMYVGNGNNGHYYSLCQYNNRLYKFNDSMVSECADYHGKMITSIYQRVQQKPPNLEGQDRNHKKLERLFVLNLRGVFILCQILPILWAIAN